MLSIMATRRLELGEAGTAVRKAVRRARHRNDWTLDQLSERMADAGRPMSKATLSQIETGNRRVDVDDLVALAFALMIAPADLLPATDEDRAVRTEIETRFEELREESRRVDEQSQRLRRLLKQGRQILDEGNDLFRGRTDGDD